MCFFLFTKSRKIEGSWSNIHHFKTNLRISETSGGVGRVGWVGRRGKVWRVGGPILTDVCLCAGATDSWRYRLIYTTFAIDNNDNCVASAIYRTSTGEQLLRSKPLGLPQNGICTAISKSIFMSYVSPLDSALSATSSISPPYSSISSPQVTASR